MSKAETLAQEMASMLEAGTLTYDNAVAVMEKAIRHGRLLERRAAIRRLNSGYDKGEFGGGDLTSWESRDVAIRLVRGISEPL